MYLLKTGAERVLAYGKRVLCTRSNYYSRVAWLNACIIITWI